MRWWTTPALFATLALVACGPRVVEPTATHDALEGKAAGDDEERGVASYYSNKLAGHKTASGERYDPKELTAAHKTLPFGTIVEVRRDDGRHVRVRINDRGPFVKGRVIDLSHKAAEEIGLVKDGVAKVTVSVVDGP
jgi:rare lipoprotein A